MLAKILIVEDNPSILKLVRVNLAARGFEVIEARTAEEGLGCLNHHQPDGIVLDLLLPEMSGLDFLEALSSNSRWSNIPVVVASAVSNGPLHRAIEYHNVLHTFVKPLEITDLLTVIHEVILPASQ